MKTLEIVKLVQGDFSCEILANYGASLNSYKYKNEEFVYGYTHPEQIVKQKYKGVVLAPFPNRIAEGKYTFAGHSYDLPINREKEGLALHGLLYDKSFEVILKKESEVILQYNYDLDIPSYPFVFQLTVHYSLQENGTLSIKTGVLNQSTKEMPFGLGWHPYFKIGQSVDKLMLSFPPSAKLLVDSTLIPTGEEECFQNELNMIALAEHQFDDCFRLTESRFSEFILTDGNRNLSVKAEAVTEFPFFQIYTPKDRATIAIEPMTCAPDAFNNGIGLHVLKGKEEKHFQYTLQAY